MRVRKGLLALQDFQKHLTTHEMIRVLKKVTKSPDIHLEIKKALSNSIKLLKAADVAYDIHGFIKSGYSVFHKRNENKQSDKVNKDDSRIKNQQ
jgi:hypothetical protein